MVLWYTSLLSDRMECGSRDYSRTESISLDNCRSCCGSLVWRIDRAILDTFWTPWWSWRLHPLNFWSQVTYPFVESQLLDTIQEVQMFSVTQPSSHIDHTWSSSSITRQSSDSQSLTGDGRPRCILRLLRNSAMNRTSEPALWWKSYSQSSQWN